MPVQYRIRPRLCPVGMAGEPDADAARATALFSLLLGEPAGSACWAWRSPERRALAEPGTSPRCRP
ncbi:hypothetical protein [Amycolatopsis silviterrae]|uniref:Uncharacterized protein n=1 Tax=Amycolatopsis silviterrae TaxID=1656914 RepID=A0ABW5HGU7_9PSEU